MASRSATVLVILVVAIIAFCFAGVFASMTGTYHLNLTFGNDSNDTGFFGNLTEFNSGDSDSSSGSDSVVTYSEESSDSSSSSAEPTEDTSMPSSETPDDQSGVTPNPDSSGNNPT